MKMMIYTILTAHVVALIFILVKFFTGLDVGYPESIDESQIQSIGQVLSSADIACGVISYYQAGKGRPHILLLLIPVIAAPVYAWIGGPTQTVLFYILVALVIQGLALFRFHIHGKAGQNHAG